MIALRLLAGCELTLRRLRANWALPFATLVAMTTLVGIWAGLPLYAEAASKRLLAAEVEGSAAERVPFGYLFSYNRLSGGPKPWENLSPVDRFLFGDDAPFGSTVRASSRLIETQQFQLVRPVGNSGDDAEPIARFSLTSTGVFDDAVEIVSGRAAVASTSSLTNGIEVVLEQSIADELGLRAGERLSLVNPRAAADDPVRVFDVTLTGTWALTDQTEGASSPPEGRFARVPTVRNSLVVPEATMLQVIDPGIADAVANAQWLVLLEASSVGIGEVDRLVARTSQINRTVDELVPGTRLLASPEVPLRRYQQRVVSLERGLAAYSLPLLVLVLAVVALLIGSAVSTRRPELALLRSRGVSAQQVVVVGAFEALVLALIAALLGLLLARYVARLIGTTETFLRFGSDISLDLAFTPRVLQAAAIAGVVLVFLQVTPLIAASRPTRVETARSRGALRAPWWQRSYIDLAIIVLVAFFTWWAIGKDALTGDLLDDPVVILLPAANAVAAGLVVLRVFPVAMGILAKAAERSSATSLLLASRQTARVRGATAAPVLLLVVTGSLAIYTGSLARTLDLQVLDAAHHRVGAAKVLDDNGIVSFASWRIVDGSPRPPAQPATNRYATTAELSRVWGLESSSRLAKTPASLELPGGDTAGLGFIGIDPASFNGLAFWRDDYASASLATLMARLAATPDGVLAPSRVLRQQGLSIGDEITIRLSGESRTSTFRAVIVGEFEQFPTWYPATDLAPLVGDLSDAEARVGPLGERLLLVETNDDIRDQSQYRVDLDRLGVSTDGPASPETLVQTAQERPERQGVFGLLTLSFLVSAACSIFGFVFYAIRGFRRQVTELGVLRALGLKSRGLLSMVGFDLLFVALTGLVVAVGVGVAMSRWLLPRLISTPSGSAPALLEEIDWLAALTITTGLFAALLVVGTLLLARLRRLELFRAIKLGATQ